MDKIWEDFTQDVERDEHGNPIALSRWGWKKEQIDGKTYLLAASEMELFALRSIKAGHVLTQAELKDIPNFCYGGNTGCYPPAGCKQCMGIVDSGYITCVCIA